MTVRTPPSWLQAGSHPAEQDRLMLASLVDVPGILPSAGLADQTVDGGIVQHLTGAMTVDMAPFTALLAGTETPTQGVYHVINDAVLPVAIAASDPTNDRIDVIGIRVRDAAYSGAVNNAAAFVVTGVPSGAPAVPALPDNFIPCSHIAVGAGVTAILDVDITDVRTAGALRGGTMVLGDLARLPAFLPGGKAVYSDAGDELEGPLHEHSGGELRKPWNMPWGTLDSTNSNVTLSGLGTSIVAVAGLTAAVPDPVDHRRYRIKGTINVTKHGTGDIICTIQKCGLVMGVLTPGGPEQHRTRFSLEDGEDGTIVVDWEWPTTAGVPDGFGFVLGCGSGTYDITIPNGSQNQIAVVDDGPWPGLAPA